MVDYSLDYFKNNSTLYKLAEECDSTQNNGNNNRILDNNEVSIFNNKIKSLLGNDFNFEKIGDEAYLDNLQIEYERAISNNEEREKLINEKTENNEYKIEPFVKDGKKMYEITVLKEINCGQVSKDLNLAGGAIAKNNYGYGQYDYNGHHISNKPMQNVTFVVDANDMCPTSSWDNIVDFFKSKFY